MRVLLDFQSLLSFHQVMMTESLEAVRKTWQQSQSKSQEWNVPVSIWDSLSVSCLGVPGENKSNNRDREECRSWMVLYLSEAW